MVGHYDLEIAQAGFRPYRRTGIMVDVNSALTVDAVLIVGARSDAVTVTENSVRVETTSTQMGEVVTGRQMAAVPLNGRSYTDCLRCNPALHQSLPSHPRLFRTWERVHFRPLEI